MLKMLKP
jgi:hypothetical protein